MWLIIGLGNPGQQYENTRHNVGFLFLDYLARRFDSSILNGKFESLYGKGTVFGQEVVFLKPLTFMNVSGKAVTQVASFFKIIPENTIVVTDDLDQAHGAVRLRFGGGHGGHNGLRSILECWGGNDKFHRAKIGIGKPEHKTQVTSWVLGKFSESELLDLEKNIFPICEERLRQILK
jgi:peptidyl-tRNA hydrolase, PTH1 family